MQWIEKKETNKYTYTAKDIFGIMKLESPSKLNAENLDDIFLAVFQAGKKTSAGTMIGTVDGMDDVNYEFIKTDQWIMDETKEKKLTKKEIMKQAYDLSPEEDNYQLALFNMIKKLKKLITFYKESHKLHSLLALESKNYIAKREGSDKRKVTLKREGKDVEITEAELWEGQRFGSQEAIDFLSKKYPSLWQIGKAREEQKKKCDDILVSIFGFDLTEMNAFKLVKMVETFTILFVLPTVLIFSIAIVIALIV